jgi:predicted RNA-binding protein with PUA domain
MINPEVELYQHYLKEYGAKKLIKILEKVIVAQEKSEKQHRDHKNLSVPKKLSNLAKNIIDKNI